MAKEKQNWKPIDLMDVLGMASNPVNPGTKFAKRLLNVYTHEKPGALTLRPGYAPKYIAPTHSTLISTSVINFAPFFDRQADPEGVEIICDIQKGIVQALEGFGPGGRIVANTMEGFQFWVRPYWDGTQWLNNWQWVNKTIITIIEQVDATFKTHFRIFGDFQVHGIATDSLIGWTIYNVDKDEYAKIITNEATDVIGNYGYNDINITVFLNSWEVDDVIIMSRNWIDIDTQLEFFNNIEKEDIVFHRINNDLRIGFGGRENRPGLMVGYRKNFYKTSELDFSNFHPALLLPDVIEKFSKTDGVIVENAVISEQARNDYVIGTETGVGGTFAAGTYNIKMTVLLDNYAEQLVAEKSVTIGDDYDIRLYALVKLGRESLRSIKLKFYLSPVNDDLNFYLYGTQDLKTIDEYTPEELKINDGGYVVTPVFSLSGSGEYYNEEDALSITDEANTIGGWQNQSHPDWVFSSIDTFTFAWGDITAQSGTYYFLLRNTTGLARNMKIVSPLIATAKRKFTIEFYAIPDFATTSIRVSSTGTSEFIDISITTSGSWVLCSAELEIQGSLVLSIDAVNNPLMIGIDSLTITPTESVQAGTEISSEMAYTPTFDIVKGWDQALVKRGRVYYLNPYLEKRYENFLVVSHIAPTNTFMWDIASFSNFRELENNDSNTTIAIELLQNDEILILKDSSVTTLIDDGLVGIMRQPIYGVDLVSRVSIVNINGLVFWCGKEEIYLVNIGSSLIPKPLLKDTIRDLYLAIEDKTKIFGTRNRFNTFRIRINDSEQKTEYLLTENGWVEERKWHFPEIYRSGFNNLLYFLSNGIIYEENVDFSLTEVPYGEP